MQGLVEIHCVNKNRAFAAIFSGKFDSFMLVNTQKINSKKERNEWCKKTSHNKLRDNIMVNRCYFGSYYYFAAAVACFVDSFSWLLLLILGVYFKQFYQCRKVSFISSYVVNPILTFWVSNDFSKF